MTDPTPSNGQTEIQRRHDEALAGFRANNAPVPTAPSSDTPSDGCDDCEREGRNCTAHGGRPGIPTSSDTLSDEMEMVCDASSTSGTRWQRKATDWECRVDHSVDGWCFAAFAGSRPDTHLGCGWPAPPPTPVDGDSGRASEQFIEALTEAMQNAWNDFVGDTGCYPDDFEIHGNELHAQFGRSNFVRFVAGWLPTAPPVGEERRPVDGGERSQSEQWFVVHHNQLRSLRFGTFPIERFARASIAACTCGPHTLRHTVTTTYTASTTEEFVAAAADRGEG